LHGIHGAGEISDETVARRVEDPTAMRGDEKIIEADESYVGGKARNKAYGPPPKKMAVFTLVERSGEARSTHIANVTAETVRPLIVTAASRKSHFRTDESGIYWKVGEEFKTHETVVHSAEEYVRGDAHVNTAEGYFAILKRGIYGIYHHVSEAHLHRYLAEFDFRHNNRAKLGIEDEERAATLLPGVNGKRLLYRQPDEAPNA
jgi:ISXO2-like transposase domain